MLLAAKYIPVERLGATDDCGFSPFSRDVKPKHGSPDFARDIAMQKITARLEGVELARQELGRHGVRFVAGRDVWGPAGDARRSVVDGRAVGATGHHLAPNPSLPLPLASPAAWSPEK